MGSVEFSCCLLARGKIKLTRCIAEFAVADIKDIIWNPAAFTELAIPTKKKEVIQALAEAHTSREIDHTFDDFVVGKGLGLIILLQYGLQILFSCIVLILLPVVTQASARR